MFLLSSAHFFFFFKNSFRNTIRVSYGLDPDQDQHFVSPDLSQTVCKGYQQRPKVTASKERVKLWMLVADTKCFRHVRSFISFVEKE